ncbi:hypothetical protein KIPB_003331 [Kipferlia bialata]|uniref:Uncharacterized protein n=1 Tax=Kipferlia bialata TaxID=797122 RepID=A0A9K3CSS2_9EUKA|nr:hypothetical protein KIPB_003331 [Kipferlia bialata]|eukprot:g3331.t1
MEKEHTHSVLSGVQQALDFLNHFHVVLKPLLNHQGSEEGEAELTGISQALLSCFNIPAICEMALKVSTVSPAMANRVLATAVSLYELNTAQDRTPISKVEQAMHEITVPQLADGFLQTLQKGDENARAFVFEALQVLMSEGETAQWHKDFEAQLLSNVGIAVQSIGSIGQMEYESWRARLGAATTGVLRSLHSNEQTRHLLPSVAQHIQQALPKTLVSVLSDSVRTPVPTYATACRLLAFVSEWDACCVELGVPAVRGTVDVAQTILEAAPDMVTEALRTEYMNRFSEDDSADVEPVEGETPEPRLPLSVALFRETFTVDVPALPSVLSLREQMAVRAAGTMLLVHEDKIRSLEAPTVDKLYVEPSYTSLGDMSAHILRLTGLRDQVETVREQWGLRYLDCTDVCGRIDTLLEGAVSLHTGLVLLANRRNFRSLLADLPHAVSLERWLKSGHAAIKAGMWALGKLLNKQDVTLDVPKRLEEAVATHACTMMVAVLLSRSLSTLASSVVEEQRQGTEALLRSLVAHKCALLKGTLADLQLSSNFYAGTTLVVNALVDAVGHDNTEKAKSALGALVSRHRASVFSFHALKLLYAKGMSEREKEREMEHSEEDLVSESYVPPLDGLCILSVVDNACLALHPVMTGVAPTKGGLTIDSIAYKTPAICHRGKTPIVVECSLSRTLEEPLSAATKMWVDSICVLVDGMELPCAPVVGEARNTITFTQVCPEGLAYGGHSVALEWDPYRHGPVTHKFVCVPRVEMTLPPSPWRQGSATRVMVKVSDDYTTPQDAQLVQDSLILAIDTLRQSAVGSPTIVPVRAEAGVLRPVELRWNNVTVARERVEVVPMSL